jgi:hypothetical protein
MPSRHTRTERYCIGSQWWGFSFLAAGQLEIAMLGGFHGLVPLHRRGGDWCCIHRCGRLLYNVAHGIF